MTGSFGSKIGALSRGHHLSGERTVVNLWQRYLVDPKGPRAFARSEMDQTWTRPWYQLNVPLNFYWGAVNALNAGQSIWDISRVALQVSKQQGFDYSFFFFNKYAGQIYPATATDAFCALHKGLDAADTKAYPESIFGPAQPGNIDRMEKIVAAYAKYGAAIDDRKALTYGQVQQRVTKRVSTMWAGISGPKTTPGYSSKSTPTRLRSRAGASADRSPRPPRSTPGLRAASNTLPEKTPCISSCAKASPPTPRPRSCRSPSFGMTRTSVPPGNWPTMSAPRP